MSRIMMWIGAGVVLNAFPALARKGIAGMKKSRSRIVTIYHSQATDGTGGKDNVNLNDDVVRQMVDEGVKAFSGEKNLKEAWSSIIPDPGKRVAIKVNCQIEAIYTKAKVVKPIVDGLVLRGVSPDNIIIYDKTDTAFRLAGFEKNIGPGVKIGTVKDFGGYHRFLFTRLAKLLTGGVFKENDYKCDYLINVPVLKALDGYSGVSLSMKNHYGSIGNPQDHHKDIMAYLPELNNLPYIREKTRLIVMDAIFIEYKWINGRDQKYVDVMNKIMISDDTVAIDFVGWNVIEEKRSEHGLQPIAPNPIFIDNAAGIELGNNNFDMIDIITVDLK